PSEEDGPDLEAGAFPRRPCLDRFHAGGFPAPGGAALIFRDSAPGLRSRGAFVMVGQPTSMRRSACAAVLTASMLLVSGCAGFLHRIPRGIPGTDVIGPRVEP